MKWKTNNVDLRESFEDLLEASNPRQRAIQFENLWKQLLSENGFEVQRNSKITSPRQTDLVARHDKQDFLIEVDLTEILYQSQ